MLESYEHEIIRKRRASGIFWFLVFSFALFLYFFFQGYYPSIDFSVKELFQSGGLRNVEREELVRSFGIINIRVEPRDARITINGDDLSYDEKKMVAYDDYRLSVGKPGYIQDWVDFSIAKERPYYIDEVHLIPRARYTQIGTGSVTFTKVGDTSWISEGLVYDSTFSSGQVISGKGGNPIGEGYFQSGSSLISYEKGVWQRKAWSGSTLFLRNCKDAISMRQSTLYCEKSKEALTEDGRYLTGVTAIGPDYILRDKTLIDDTRTYRLTEAEQKLHLFIRKDAVWYIPSGGNLIPLVSTSGSHIPLITTPLDEIRYATWVDGALAIFGKKGSDTFVTFISDRNSTSLISFPDIPLEEVRLSKYDGNVFFKTRHALLFLYKNSKRVEWIVDGEILAHSPVAAIYRKDGEIWKANWEKRE